MLRSLFLPEMFACAHIFAGLIPDSKNPSSRGRWLIVVIDQRTLTG
ncbi:hypothetical protein [Ralstonia pseudosolanacearum]|nr:hypothetical protein [Ralstonia pseudosolanacearum]QWF11950.1 hypothetical protein KME70_01905 [Ralstonia solanacearum]